MYCKRNCACQPSGLKKLVELYPERLKHADNDGKLPLHTLLCHKHRQFLLMFLISKSPSALQHRDNLGRLSVHLVDCDDTFFKFAKAWPESLHVATNEGHLPTYTWLTKNKVAICRANTLSKVIKLIDSSGITKVQDEMTALKSSVELATENENKLKDEIIDIKNALAASKDSLATVTDELDFQKKMTAEARKVEKAFRATILENEAPESMATLKVYAKSLKARLHLSKEQLQPNSKPSLVQVMFTGFIKDPDLSRSSLVECIEMLESELSCLEGTAKALESNDGNDIEMSEEELSSSLDDDHVRIGNRKRAFKATLSANSSVSVPKQHRVSDF